MPPRNTWRRASVASAVDAEVARVEKQKPPSVSRKTEHPPLVAARTTKHKRNTWVRGVAPSVTAATAAAADVTAPTGAVSRKGSKWVRKTSTSSSGGPATIVAASSSAPEEKEKVSTSKATVQPEAETTPQKRYVRQRSHKLLLKPAITPTTTAKAARRQRASIGSAESLLLHAARAVRKTNADARERQEVVGARPLGAINVPGKGASRVVVVGRRRLVLRHATVGGKPSSSTLMYRKVSGGYSLRREDAAGAKKKRGEGDGVGDGVGQRRSKKKKLTWTNPALQPNTSTSPRTLARSGQSGDGGGGGGGEDYTKKLVVSEVVEKIRGEYSRSRRGLSLLRRRLGPVPAMKGKGARLAMAPGALTKTESTQRRAAAAGRLKLSLARARGVKGEGGNKWRRAGIAPSTHTPERPPWRISNGGGSSSRPGTTRLAASIIRLCGRFIRTGKCARRHAPGAARCTRRHDSDKVAVCTRWLAGTCNTGKECPLTHRVIPERMPACSYFLAGACASLSCPYLHVNVDPMAPVCQSFLKGYCPRGLQCRMRHTLVCPALTGGNKTCPNRAACRFHHPTNALNHTNHRGFKRAREEEEEEDNNDENHLPPICQPCADED